MNDLAKQFIEILKNPVNKEKGIRYEFAKSMLRKGNCRFCAGGIMCDLAVQNSDGRYVWEQDGLNQWLVVDNNFLEKGFESRSYSEIPRSIYEMFGIYNLSFLLNNKQVNLIQPHHYYRLHQDRIMSMTVMNDIGIPWSVIADVVEEEINKEEF